MTERCAHDPAACCWLCSDQVSWWRAARIKAGLLEEPINRTQAPTKSQPERTYWGYSPAQRIFHTMTPEEEAQWAIDLKTPRMVVRKSRAESRRLRVPGAGYSGVRS